MSFIECAHEFYTYLVRDWTILAKIFVLSLHTRKLPLCVVPSAPGKEI